MSAYPVSSVKKIRYKPAAPQEGLKICFMLLLLIHVVFDCTVTMLRMKFRLWVPIEQQRSRQFCCFVVVTIAIMQLAEL